MKRLNFSLKAGLFLLVSSLAFSAPAAQSAQASYDSLEKEFNALAQRENNYYASRQQAAEAAQAKYDKDLVLYNDILAKQEQLEAMKEVKFYKEQYHMLAKKYEGVKKQLVNDMKVQKKIVEDFAKFQAQRGGN